MKGLKKNRKRRAVGERADWPITGTLRAIDFLVIRSFRSPQVSLSQSDVAAEIIIYCMYADLQRMITKLSMGIQREKDTIFDASHLQLSYPCEYTILESSYKWDSEFAIL